MDVFDDARKVEVAMQNILRLMEEEEVGFRDDARRVGENMKKVRRIADQEAGEI